ncbi:MAG: HD domain-containing protein [Patescibacteria group bacterium]|nr:HD domain-containing protein [Patescibacteria group bacterium]
MKKKDINIKIFQKALKTEPALSFINKVLKKFSQAEIYLVGGAVRDIILKRKTKDFDFVVRNLSAKKLENFLKKSGKVNLVGKSFGVFKFVPKNSKIEAIDIALPRTEHSLKMTGGYRDFKVQSKARLPIEKDLKRRDFTINALAYDIKNKKLIDKFNGLSDLASKQIRAVGQAEKRFKEDYTRILRALRFCCQLSFELEEKTAKAIKNFSLKLKSKSLAREVMAKELLNTFEANPLRAFDIFDEMNIFKHLIPEIENLKGVPQPVRYHSEGDVFVHTRLALEKLNSPLYKKIMPGRTKDPEVILAIIFHDIGKAKTIRTPKKDGTNRIRFDAHDTIGAEMTSDIIDRLKLESTGKVKKENIIWLVKRHMLLIVDDPYNLRASTVEKIFFNPRVPGEKLLKIILADTLGSLPAKGKANTKSLEKMLKRIKEMKNMDKKRKALPKPLINGHDIIKNLNIKRGPLIGELLSIAREQQLNSQIKNKKQALEFLKNYLYAKKNKSKSESRKRKTG